MSQGTRKIMNGLLEIFICVKSATQVQEPIRFTPDSRNLATECRGWARNRADHFALEEGLRLRENGQVETISCITVGPDPAVDALVYCLAAGAGRGGLIPVPRDL